MKKTAFGAVAAFALVIIAAPGFAGERNAGIGDSGSNIENQCDNILASKDGHAPGAVRYCENNR